jgi:hypothetical protein
MFQVFGYGVANETSSLDETSGADSGDDFAAVRKSSSCSSASTSSSSSPSASPTAELQKYKFDRKESFPIADVLICHTDKRNLNCVVWVVRTPGGGPGSSGGLEALVFECFGEENVKELYRNFLEVSKRSKLERHRRRRSEGGGGFSNNNDDQQLKSQNVWQQQQQQQPTSQQHHSRRQQNNGLWNLVRHTDRNGITHIEVESQRRQQNGENEKISVSNKKPSEKSKFAKELESILSKELENRRNEGGRNGLGSASPGSSAKIWGPRSTGEPQSLRQRAPALLLRKLDEFEEMAHRVWAGTPPDGDADNDNRKIWQRPEPSKGASRTPPPSSRRLHDIDGRRRERLERLRVELMQQKSEENANKEANAKSASSQAPTAASTSVTNTTTAATTPAPSTTPVATPAQTTPVTKKESEKQILIPTKTGKEPVRKLYPKESPPDQIRARFVPVAIPIQFATAQQFSPQPLSLPIYPMQVAPVAWARYPGDFNDPNNNMNQIARAQWAAAARVQVVPDQAFAVREARGRSRDRADLDPRRRAQSKSPARRPVPASGGYLDNVASDMSELSKKFRVFGDAVRQRMSRKSGPGPSGPVQTGLDNGQLKSNLKKQRDQNGMSYGGNSVLGGSQTENLPTNNVQQTSNSNNDNKKVHFNKFATVQMME